MKLILKLVTGIIVGIIIGLLNVEVLTRILITVKDVFGQFINFMIPLIILFFIAAGVSKLGKQSGKLVGLTVGSAYVSTFLAGVLAFFVAVTVIPFISPDGTAPGEGTALEGYFSFEIAPLMGVITALVLAFVFGISMAKLQSKVLINVFDEGRAIVELVIKKIIIPFLPFYIAGIFAQLASEGTVFDTLRVFGIVLLVAILTHWVWLIIQYIVAGVVSGRNPFVLLKTMLPAYFTAIGTMSSAATIPVTLKQAKENKVREEVANFSIPLFATIHLSGSVITIVTCAIAVMTIQSGLTPPNIIEMIPVILMLGVIMIAAPGVPGGAIMAALGILTSMLGFTEVAIGLMIALYMAQDSFGTAANVTGDGALSVLIDKSSDKKD
ncbi:MULTISPECIES: dicarboxylate/amino acid:cation symporter [Bacillaceae]|uniref:Dicarboxylate/amino acid:cation symporter n=1 Tax=Evansella alkalicola TaxID=745819 RepID=A0ABS6JT87_9BACI|nr:MULTISPECIES: dicarboxylate/amino acid:cation symporter [Bacillaceae]MBU9721793.1 dicarboxylate/amino acid:cation symporter [Bacillus alkalicola]